MRFLLGLVLFCGAVLPCLSQATGNGPSLPKDPRELLNATAPLYDFSDPALKPWHLKVSYELFDLQGKPDKQGTFEYWWASPKVHRSSWTRSDAARTDWATADGKLFRKESGGHIHYLERALLQIVLSPLPNPALIESGRMELGLKTVPAGQVKLPCVTGSLRMLKDGKLETHASRTQEYFCFDPVSLAVRMTTADLITTAYNQIVKTQGHYLAKQVDASIGAQKLISITVDKIDGVDPSDPALIPAADAMEKNTLSLTGTCVAGDDVKNGSLENKVSPYYPSIAKAAREEGEVILGAGIGTDGNIHDLEVLSTPAPSLADAAVEAVKQWHYRPCLSNGVAVEVDMIEHAIFTLGR
jgi:TonB family protein